jgi:uncharacterized repeat protein (TIGR03803 family)
VNKLTLSKLVCILFAFCAATAIASPAQILTTLHSFAGYPSDGANPYAGLVQGSDGNFYGTTYWGGAHNNCYAYTCGTVFKITPSGALSTLHSFAGSVRSRLCCRAWHQKHGKLAVHQLSVLGGAVNVGGESHSVAHGDHDVFRYGDAVAYVGLSTKWDACCDHNQQAHN